MGTRVIVAGVVAAGVMAFAIVDRQAEASPVSFRLAESPVAVGSMPGTPVVADVNQDGKSDVVVACGPCCGMSPQPDSGHVQVLLGDGTGKLRAAGPPVKVGPTALRVAVGDVNEDGHADIACVQHSSYEVAVLLGDGTGAFTARRLKKFTLHDGSSPHVHAVSLADVNEDGHLDILATLVDDHALAVLLGDGKGTFAPALGQPYFAHRHPYEQLNVFDFNGDEHLDVLCTDVRGNGITVLAGSGTGMFVPSTGFSLEAHTPIAGGERPLAAALGDFDGDGDPDVVAAIDESPLAVLLINQGGGAFAPPAEPKVPLAVPTILVRTADVDGDGTVDIVASGTATDRISVCLGLGAARFGGAIAVEAGGDSPSIALGDLNGDGRVDIVTGNYASGTVGVLINER